MMDVSNLTRSNEEPYYNVTLLLELDCSRRMFQLPVIIFFVFILIAGFVGNLLVIIIYFFFSSKSPSNHFIKVLAILDFLSCVIFVPFHIYVMWYPYTNSLPIFCRIEKFLENTVHLWSGFVLVCVAAERYVKICTPLHYFGIRNASILTFLTAMIALSLSWPQFVMHGKKTLLIGAMKVVGEDCSFSDFYQHSIYVFLYHGLLYFVYFICGGIFFYFYGNIVRAIIKRKSSLKHSPPREIGTDNKKGINHKKSLALRTVTGKQMRPSRTTCCLSVVTATALLSFIPILTVQTLRASGLLFKETVTPSGQFYHYGSSSQIEYVYIVCMRSHFISIVANPIIYSAINPIFRKRVKEVIAKLQKGSSFKTT